MSLHHFITPFLGVQAWLQEFAWTEAEKLQKWKTRAGNLRLTSAALHDLNKEPMFCFESAIKLYYYSHIIYQYHKVCGHCEAGCTSHAASAQFLPLQNAKMLMRLSSLEGI